MPALSIFNTAFGHEMADETVWLNTAHQGRLPTRAVDALAEAVQWKLHPEMLAGSERFTTVPARLRSALAGVLGAGEDEVILANSASYGLHLLANGLDLRRGDEVLVAANDFPSDILPWLMLRRDGIEVRTLEPQDEVLTAEEVAGALTHRTRVVCLPWVHSFSGRIIDLHEIGQVCRTRDIWFVVNGSQAVGAMPVDVQALPVDALVSAGFKWLCGPYGTGLCWLQPELFDALRSTKLYWLSALTVEDLVAPSLNLNSISPRRTGKFDIFGTANFFNFVPFATAVELMLDLGTHRVAADVDALVIRLLAGLDWERFRLVSDAHQRSSLVVLEPLADDAHTVLERLAKGGVYVAERRGRVRISPHFYNTPNDIDRALELL